MDSHGYRPSGRPSRDGFPRFTKFEGRRQAPRSPLDDDGAGLPEGERRPRDPRRTIATVRDGVRNTWTSIVRVFALVWSTSRSLTVGLGTVTLLSSVIPALQVWLAGLLIDEVVEGIEQGLGDEHIRPVAVLAGLQLALFLGASLFQTIGNICQQLLQERLSIHVQLTIMEHANTLDLADFENAAYYDQLQQAQRESANRPVQMVSGVFGLIRSTITFSTLIALLVSLSPWVALLTLVTPIPAFISGTRYGWWGFQQMRRQSPARRRMSYISTLLTTDTFNKEIKLFTLGEHFIRRYRTTADSYYAETRDLLVRRYVSGFLWGALPLPPRPAPSSTWRYWRCAAQSRSGRSRSTRRQCSSSKARFRDCSAGCRASTSTGST